MPEARPVAMTGAMHPMCPCELPIVGILSPGQGGRSLDPESCDQLFDWHGAGEQVALAEIAPGLTETLEDVLDFNCFADHTEGKIVSKFDDQRRANVTKRRVGDSRGAPPIRLTELIRSAM
jgi:hypothetical protein